MTATTTVPSASVQAKSRALLEMRSEWATVRDAKTGQRRIVMPSLTDNGRVHYVHPTGDACSCKAGQNGTMCGHRLAAREAANRDALEAWLNDMDTSVAMKPADKPRARYEDIMGVCDDVRCDEDRAKGERYCHRHMLVDAF